MKKISSILAVIILTLILLDWLYLLFIAHGSEFLWAGIAAILALGTLAKESLDKD